MTYYYGNRSPPNVPINISNHYNNEYSPLASQIYPTNSSANNGANSSYMYNNQATAKYSTLINNSRLNQASPILASSVYPTPRNSNGTYSPQFNSTSLSLSSSSTASSILSSSASSLNSNRLKFFNAKGFELEDDMEFCPDIQETAQHHPKFNPYTSSSFSPQSSPNSVNNLPISPSNKLASANSPRVHTPRVKKPLEIVNPLTGMRVSSPAIKS